MPKKPRKPVHTLGLLLAAILITPALAQGTAPTTQSFDFLTLELVEDGFTSPVALVAAPNDSRLFVVDLVGKVHLIEEDGSRASEPFLDLTDKLVELTEEYDERGLLGLAFHPDFANNGRLFAYYSAPLRDSAPATWNHTNVLSEFTLESGSSTVDPSSERVLLEFDHPQMNHNGGTLLFDNDGYLYLSIGDGGSGGDVAPGHPPMGNAQDVTTLHGSIIRLDVNATNGEPYGIPATNPFAKGVDLPDGYDWAGDEARPEIYLWGLRNPYRFSYDPPTGALVVADVGQDLWEEVNYVTGPGNLGWNLREGEFGFDPTDHLAVVSASDTTPPLGDEFIEPVLTYAHPNPSVEIPDEMDVEVRGITVIGGAIYRGSDIPELNGHYVFGDWSTAFGGPGGKLFVATTGDTPDAWEFVLDRTLDEFVLGFGQDSSGELYVLTTEQPGPSGTTGKVYRLTGGK